MKYILIIILLHSSLFSLQTSNRLFECTEIFQERKNELLVELERIDEQKQALDSLKIATESLLKKKEAKISQKEEYIDKKLAEITQKEESVKKMLIEIRTSLKETQNIKMTKVAQTFAKMKAGSSASILSVMSPKEAINILQSLKPKTVGQILTKMDSKKASELTILLSK